MATVLRALVRQKRFALGVVATLALGIAVTIFLFAVLNAVVLRPLPYREPHQLAMLWTNDVKRGIPEEGVGYPTVEDWRKRSRVFSDFAVCGRGDHALLTGQPEPERIEIAVVSANLWDVLGVPPSRGRAFSPAEEANSERVAVISHRLWTRRKPQTIELDGRPYQVIGVMRASFAFPSREVDAWIPLPAHSFYRGLRERREMDYLKVVGRLRPGQTLASGHREMNEIGRRLAVEYPSSDPDFAGYAVTVWPFSRQYVGDSLPRALWLLMGAVGLVLLAACANAAGLLFARNHARVREDAVRAALGAGRSVLFRAQMGEALTLAAASGLLGALAGWWLLLGALAVGAGQVPRLEEATFDWRVAMVAVGASLLTALLCGPVTAWRAARISPADAMRAGGAARGAAASYRTQWWIAAVQAAFSVVLLAGAALLLRHLLELHRAEPGFRTERTWLLRVESTAAAPHVFWRGVLARLHALPGVKAGAVGSFARDRNPDNTAFLEGRGVVFNQQLAGDSVTAGFFEAAGARLLQGRFFTAAEYDSANPNAIVINDTMARRFWPGENALGKRLQWGSRRREDHPWWVVVGVIQDMRRMGLDRPAVSEAFRPGAAGAMDLLVHSPVLSLTDVRAAIRAEDARVPVYRILPLAELLAASTLSSRLQAVLLGGFAALTLALAAIGLYATLQQTVLARRREFGIRLALGARPAHVFRQVLGSGVMVAAAGAAGGAAAAVAVERLVRSLLPGGGASAGDWRLLLLAAGMLIMVAAGACAMPAWRAARVEPASVLHD